MKSRFPGSKRLGSWAGGIDDLLTYAEKLNRELKAVNAAMNRPENEMEAPKHSCHVFLSDKSHSRGDLEDILTSVDPKSVEGLSITSQIGNEFDRTGAFVRVELKMHQYGGAVVSVDAPDKLKRNTLLETTRDSLNPGIPYWGRFPIAGLRFSLGFIILTIPLLVFGYAFLSRGPIWIAIALYAVLLGTWIAQAGFRYLALPGFQLWRSNSNEVPHGSKVLGACVAAAATLTVFAVPLLLAG